MGISPSSPHSGEGLRFPDGLRFLKGHGTGNDFVVLPDPDGELDLKPQLIQRLCDRRFGIGADGILRVVRADHAPSETVRDGARWFMDYRNADGSIAEMCGNGVRVYARFLVEAGWEQPGELLLATRGGLKRVHVPAAGDVSVEMGPPEIARDSAKVEVDGEAYEGVVVSMGNPHLVVQLDSPDAVRGLDLHRLPAVAADIFPDGTNVEFFADRPEGGAVVMRVHERGVGETLSCGTGACAVAVAALGSAGGRVDVDVPGGRLGVEWRPDTMVLTGPAELVADGEWLAC